jgi:hypothetical protein
LRSFLDYALALIVSGLILADILWGIVKRATGGRCENMTEEEFEAEARPPSLITSEMMELQKMYASSHRAEYILEQQKRAEADGSESGDKPSPGETKPI